MSGDHSSIPENPGHAGPPPHPGAQPRPDLSDSVVIPSFGREKPIHDFNAPGSTPATPTLSSPDDAPMEPAEHSTEQVLASATPEPAPVTPPGLAFEPAPNVPPPPPERPLAAIPARPPGSPYPMRYDVAYPERMSRWKTLLRLPLVIPAYLFVEFLQYVVFALFVVGWTAVFWRKKYPSWAFAGASGALGFIARLNAYYFLLTDKYPSFDREKSPVLLEFDDPPNGHLSRWRVFWWKLLLLIPQFIVLGFLNIALFVVTILAWFGILFTGNYPRGMFQFSVGIQRWYFRVASYFASFNDRLPPYALSADAEPEGDSTAIASGIIGVVVLGALAALTTLAVVLTGKTHNETVSYAALQKGESPISVRFDTASGPVVLTLVRVFDPGDAQLPLLHLAPDERVVVFEWTLRNNSDSSKAISAVPVHLKTWFPGHHIGGPGPAPDLDYDPRLTIVGNHSAPASVPAHSTVAIDAAFVIPLNEAPLQLQIHNGFMNRGGVTYHFE